MKASIRKHGIPKTNLMLQTKCSVLFTFFSLGSLLPVQKHQNPKNTWIAKGILKSRDMLKFYDMVVYVDDCDAMYIVISQFRICYFYYYHTQVVPVLSDNPFRYCLSRP